MKIPHFIICFILMACLNKAECLTPQYAAIVVDAATGSVLEQEAADVLCHPASLTKIMTLYMIFDALKSRKIRMGTQVRVSAHAARQIPSKLGLKAGEYISVENIIKALVTKSANDAAAAIAEHFAGNESDFAILMTRKAKKLGMYNTVFKNASGVPNPYQVTTARDMATLSRALYLHFPQDYRHFRLQSFTHRGRTHKNHNKLLGKVWGLDGLKTGWIESSGFNLAASAVRLGTDNKPKRLIVVVLGGPNRHWRDQRVVNLLEANFQTIELGGESFHHDPDMDREDSEVEVFLKEEKAKEKSAKASGHLVPVSWPLPDIDSEDQDFLEKPLKKQHLARNLKNSIWGVQMGTCSSLKEARSRVGKALTAIGSGKASTPRLGRGKKSYYGVRLLELTRDEAEAICRKQASQGKECRILASG